MNEIYILEDRGFIFVNGEDAKDFLQNIITKDINTVTDNNSSFSSILTPQGKYLVEFFIIKHYDGYLLDCEKLNSELFIKIFFTCNSRACFEISLIFLFVVKSTNSNSFLFFFIILKVVFQNAVKKQHLI